MNKLWLAILGFIIGCVEFELINKFYSKKDKKKIGKAMFYVCVFDLLLLLFLLFLIYLK